jgi:threonine synthase
MMVCVPTAYGDALAGIWRGFQELMRLGWVTGAPRLVAVEVGGSLAEAVASGGEGVAVRPRPTSQALSIATPVSTLQALRAVRESGGTAVTVDDDMLLRTQAWLAETEGLYAELGSVAAVAGAARLQNGNFLEPNRPTVAVLSSAGLKDLGTAADRLPPLPQIPPDLAALDAALGEATTRIRHG